jgi:hypothetical protein
MIRILGGALELEFCLPKEEILLSEQTPIRIRAILLSLI